MQKINSIDNLAQQIGQLTYQLAEQENDSDSIFPTQPIANQQVLEECSADQTLRWGKTNDTTMEESEIEEPTASDTCPMGETAHADLEPVITQVIVPPMPFSQRLQQTMINQHTQDSMQIHAKVYITLPQWDAPEKAPKQSINFNLLEAPRQPSKQQECTNTLTNLNTGQLLTD